jgi:FkbM family methyltransferase
VAGAVGLAGAGRGRPGGRAAGRAAAGAPALTRLPDDWWTASPPVQVRRLGLRLELDLRDNLQRALDATGTYEPALVRFLRDELRRGDVMVDVGAHIGVHALTAAARLRRLGGGAVVAFEPAHDSASTLRAAAARNRLQLTVVEVALGAEPGTADLRADPAYDAADAGVRSLRGMAGSLGRLRPRALVVEVKQRVLDQAGVDGDEVREYLNRLGYQSTGQVLPVANEVYRPRA